MERETEALRIESEVQMETRDNRKQDWYRYTETCACGASFTVEFTASNELWANVRFEDARDAWRHDHARGCVQMRQWLATARDHDRREEDDRRQFEHALLAAKVPPRLARFLTIGRHHLRERGITTVDDLRTVLAQESDRAFLDRFKVRGLGLTSVRRLRKALLPSAAGEQDADAKRCPRCGASVPSQFFHWEDCLDCDGVSPDLETCPACHGTGGWWSCEPEEPEARGR